MPFYTIKISFTTGDSFGSEDREEVIPLFWKDINLAKQAINDIKQHNKAEEDRMPIEKAAKMPWFNGDDDGRYWEYSINLQLDDGTRQPMHTFWVGYFERLNHLEIVLKDCDGDLSFDL